MKFSHLMVAAALALGMSAQAQAAVAPDYVYDMGTVGIGDTFGPVVVTQTNPPTAYLDSVISGVLPASSMITFTYALSAGAKLFAGSSDALAEAEVGSGFEQAFGAVYLAGHTSTSFTDSTNSALLFASADFDSATNTVTAIIKNSSASLATFVTSWGAFVSKCAKLTVAASVSAVPLPAALPLFAFGVAGLAGLGYRKRKSLAA